MILVCGEALFDVFTDRECDDGTVKLDARVGGSPFNVAVGIARLGGQIGFLSGISHDSLGQRLAARLAQEGVGTEYLIRSGRRTTLSLVDLDQAGHPAYMFYGLGSADCNVTPDDLPPIGREVTAFHFGSYSLVVRPAADAYRAVAGLAGGRFISVDPNVRPTVEPDLDLWRERVEDYARLATLMKISSEDLTILYPGRAHETVVADWIAAGTRLVVITDGANAVRAWSADLGAVSVLPPKVSVVDTVGAGDSFQAAMLSRLQQAGDGDLERAVAALTASSLKDLLMYATTAAATTSGRRGADLPRLADLVEFGQPEGSE